ncbi:ATP-binding protein [Phaeacidiphilus oryzae]|uniref:ATP-binding protein n=1 Tax=Phaeacidiphilus oryzae TaxID=348818 RepID=UPI00055C5244|nr:ATP-binding protein [Phaeacidiphilus oryzae]
MSAERSPDASEPPLLASLRTALNAAPGDVPLRLHLAELLLGEGRADEAIAEAAIALQHDPASTEARALMTRALSGPGTPVQQPQPSQPQPSQPQPSQPSRSQQQPEPPSQPVFDWQQAERQVSDVDAAALDGAADPDAPDTRFFDLERSAVRLADVGGMTQVKQRLEAAFLAPMRNPELRRLYGKSLRGGLLLYGPPGCGKTFLARAIAGELGAGFVNVGLADVLDSYLGVSERNLHQIFRTARRHRPCVVFLDELDALGGRRSNLRNSAMRSTVNQLLTELDGVDADNEGLFVLAATNHPWDVDPALRRPGRLDRTLLVLPPDQEAREAILGYHLRERPVAGVDPAKIARRTEGFSGADLAHLCETAAERALLDSAASGTVRKIGQDDLVAAAREIRPSIDTWLSAARNVALYANEDGTYDELAAYLKSRKQL